MTAHRSRPPAPSVEAERDQTVGTVDTQGTVCYVLVVDDSDPDRRLAGGILRRRQAVRVTYAENGEAAIQLIDEQRPDLVLTDMQMPKRVSVHHHHMPRPRHGRISSCRVLV